MGPNLVQIDDMLCYHVLNHGQGVISKYLEKIESQKTTFLWVKTLFYLKTKFKPSAILKDEINITTSAL